MVFVLFLVFGKFYDLFLFFVFVGFRFSVVGTSGRSFVITDAKFFLKEDF